LGHLLTGIREHVSKSTEQQEESLRKLNVVHDQTVKIGGISASILRYLVFKRRGPGDYHEDLRLLQKDLVNTIYDAEADDGYDSRPPNIQLTPPDCERVQSIFLGSLQYDDMVDRERRIAMAHESTFLWVFRDNQSQNHDSRTIRWSSLREWLELDDQLYWITGKPGSGKSTLMKFLCSPIAQSAPSGDIQENPSGNKVEEQSRCRPYLEKWAGASRLVVASFYFWNSGIDLQMTQVGLLRSLLYQIAEQRPDILPILAPKQWESLCVFDHHPEHWSVQDLRGMLFRAVNILRNDSKICLFIDGLDEFDGSHDDLICLVKNLIGEDSGNVKACVASRPWSVFQKAFGHKPNLRLEDLTFDDIKNFVQSKFHADAEFENLRRRYPLFANQLMDNIVVKASGVFLWVDLVVTSLLTGMRLGDRIEDFQRRLDELPPDLEKLYEKILHSLDKFYLGHAAQYFTLVETAEAPLTIIQFSFADEESPDSAIKMNIGSMSMDETSLRIEAVNRRLNSRCKGFLEVERGLQGLQGEVMRRPSQLTVQYLHRTVRDFIKSPKAQEFLHSSTHPEFDPSMQLCLAYLMDLKNWHGRQDELHILDRVDEEPPSILSVIHCLRRASGAAQSNDGAVVELMEELKRVINRPDYTEQLSNDSKYRQRAIDSSDPRVKAFHVSGELISKSFRVWKNGTWGLENVANPGKDESFISLACVHGVVPYVRARAEWGGLIQRSKLDGDHWPLLLDALSNDVPEPRMVECLLGMGADPNFKVSKVNSQTPWIVAVTKMTLLYTIKEFNSSEEHAIAEDKWRKTLRLMSLRGATSTDVPESLLTPISRKILQDLRDEIQPNKRGLATLNNWFSAWKSG
jgi:hypothetical protein